MATNGDNHIPSPTGKWQFDESVTAHFDTMLQHSIPSYEMMRSLTYDLGRHFVIGGTSVIDIGSSRGAALEPFVQADYKGAVRPNFHALEISEPMLEVLRERFKGTPNLTIWPYDLRKISRNTPFVENSASVILSILTILFTPIDYRRKIIDTVFSTLVPGGAFFFVEKVLGNSSRLDDVMIEEYYRFKAANGYSYEDIKRKRANLEGVQVMLTPNQNVEMLRDAGFRQIDCFYRHLNFAGWIAVK